MKQYLFSFVCLVGDFFTDSIPWDSSPFNYHFSEYFWSNYSDLTRPHPKWWFSKGNPLISGKSRWVKYYFIWPDICCFFHPPNSRKSKFLLAQHFVLLLTLLIGRGPGLDRLEIESCNRLPKWMWYCKTFCLQRPKFDLKTKNRT